MRHAIQADGTPAWVAPVREHRAPVRWRRRHLNETKVGRFTALLTEFMEDCAPKRYAESTLACVRSNLANFFYYLNQNRIRSLESVTPKTITAFLNHLMNTRRTSAGRVVTGNVRRLFDWFILTGRRKASNPVIPSFHSQRKVKRLPRPYEARDLGLIWKLLEESGDVQLQLAVALGQEAGLRISEASDLRVNDVVSSWPATVRPAADEDRSRARCTVPQSQQGDA